MSPVTLLLRTFYEFPCYIQGDKSQTQTLQQINRNYKKNLNEKIEIETLKKNHNKLFSPQVSYPFFLIPINGNSI